jgi:DNA-binding LacI/PurR family transcriptional regulator
MKTPTARDVAQKAGVSLGTVSHAFHYPHKVRPSTMEKVQRAARELGYEPNLAASLLRAGPALNNATRTRMSLGFVTAEQTAACREGNTYFMRAVQLRCAELGYGFERVDLNQEVPPTAWDRILRARGVAGLILGPMYNPPPLETVDWDLFSVVRLGRYAPVREFHTVRPSIFPEVLSSNEEEIRHLRSRFL